MGGPSKTIVFRGDASGLEVDLNTALENVSKKAHSLFARLPKDIQKDLVDAQKKTVEAIKGAVTQSAVSAGMAVTGPARTTYDQALRVANGFRRETSKIAVASGQDYQRVGAAVKLTARAIGEMPDTTMNWARSMRRLTGDFDGALGVMSGLKNRALALDEPMEGLIEQAAMLSNNFNVKTTDQMDRFFGTMDAQAKRAGVSVQMLARNFGQFSGEFARMSGRGPGAFSALTASFLASEKNPEQAARNQAFGMGTLSQGVRLVEMRMRNRGFGKDFSITDANTGEVDPKKYLQAMQFMQRDMLRFYGGNKRRAIEVQAGEDIGARRAVGGFLNTDFSKVKEMADLPPEVRKAAEEYFGMPAGQFDRSLVKKNIKDAEFGEGLQGAQDAAVAAGGGAAGIAMEAATGVFGQAVDRFGNAVLTFAGRGAPIAGGGGAAAGTTSAAVGAAGAAGGILSKALPVLGAGVLGYQVGSVADDALGISDWISDKFAQLTLGPDYVSPSDSAGAPSSIPREVALSPAAARAQAEATAQALSNKVLKMQAVPSIGPPPPEQAAK